MKTKWRTPAMVVVALTTAVVLASCARAPAPPPYRTFSTPEDGVKALAEAVRNGKLDEIRAIFGPDADSLIDPADPVTARQNREVFAAAYRERWQLTTDREGARTLVVGNEQWPFPIPLVRDANGWHFDTKAGKEEVIARRIGRNELAAIRICRTYVAAQRLYAQKGHDDLPAGLFAQTFRSDPGRQNGLYWPAARGQKRSPLGDLVAYAAQEGTVLDRDGAQRAPFHGYYFRILTGQGPNAPGGAKDYVAGGRMSGGFALVAWPAHYDGSGVMTFVVSHDGVVHEKDLGPDTASAAAAIQAYNPDASWTATR